MCLARLAAVLIAGALWGAGSAAALEVEDRRLFHSTEDEARVLHVISTADTALFAPLIAAFQRRNPEIAVDYATVTSQVLAEAIQGRTAAFDLAISSAMDLQVKLANDGLTQPYTSGATQALPPWARWRDHVFAFSREPATIVLSPAAFDGLPLPRSRRDLLAALRAHPDRFRGRIGTYDVRASGLGYFFATQDSRSSETYWPLTEVMGGLNARLYCCSSDMIDAVAAGDLAVAYNVLGSYAEARRQQGADIVVVTPTDFATVMLRTAVIPRAAAAPDLAGRFIDDLITSVWNAPAGTAPFSGQVPEGSDAPPATRIGPGLMVFLDAHKRRRFLEAWAGTMVRP